ncbi:MAG: nuclear transport factor 2 family protein [Kordiimonadaceae bacterium]|nr:nuclear transport factor 2 family protein [Kordiimonadaceae bacterium]MBO6568336.1 nuclear transport factor 2 family protein [Kordiimonadaceae bacterium]MBO6963934.1 nuclear transport factor 2 family protein [Kordiimonadaceae bacterium]
MRNMVIAALAVFGLAVPSQAESEAEQVVEKLFDAMRAGDGAAIRAMVVDDARLDRLQPDGALRQGTFDRWINWVDQQAEGDADEQIFGVEVLSKSAELATVWAPFTIRYKGDLVGCGVNQFTLGKTADGWRILYGIDMPAEVDCETFPNQFAE